MTNGDYKHKFTEKSQNIMIHTRLKLCAISIKNRSIIIK